jgi:hypothetical protein
MLALAVTLHLGDFDVLAIAALIALWISLRVRRDDGPAGLDEVASHPLEQTPDLPDDSARRRSRRVGFDC